MAAWICKSPATSLGPAAPLRLARPVQQTAPLVFASPHSGRDYKPDFLAQARLDPVGLRRSEDCFVDDLFADAPAHGAPLLAATFPRAFCDANREPSDRRPHGRRGQALRDRCGLAIMTLGKPNKATSRPQGVADRA
jgi:N-formylglutamate amidohydrolase